MDALSSQVYAIPFTRNFLSQTSAPSPFLPEDIHICGNCKQSFTDIRYFLQHKNDCNALLSSATAALLDSASSSVNLQMIGSDQPLLQVVISEDNQSVIIQPQQSESIELGSNEESHEAANVLEAAATLLECGNVTTNSVSSVRRDVQIDEEDVASLLANQFAKEAVYILPNPSTNSSGTIIGSELFVKDKNTNTDTELFNSNCDNTVTVSQDSTVSVLDDVLSNSEETRIIDSNTDITVNSDNNVGIDDSCNENYDNNPSNANISVEVNDISETVQEPSILPAKRLMYCNLCSYMTMYPSDLTRHIRIHTGEKPFECSVCLQRFPRKDKLHTHLRIHTGEKPYRCQFCDYAAIDSGPLRKHLRTHTDERPFKCQFCTYSAKDTSQLTVHLRTHTGDAPFVCQFEKCGRAFKTSTDLKRHGVVHKRVHPFACKLCDYKASNKLNLQAHYQLSHNAAIDKEVFKCVASGCDFKTDSVNNFEAHQQELHTVLDILNIDNNSDKSPNKKRKYNSRASAGIKSHSCSFCSHEARNPNSLKQHVRKQHSTYGNSTGNSSGGNTRLQSRPTCQKAYQCTLCPVAFVREDSLRSHLKQHQNNNSNNNNNNHNRNNNNCVLDSAIPSPSKDMIKPQFDSSSLASPDLIGNGSFFIENIISGKYVQI